MSLRQEIEYPSDPTELRTTHDEIYTMLKSLDDDAQEKAKNVEEYNRIVEPLRPHWSELNWLRGQLDRLTPESLPEWISLNIGRPMEDLESKVGELHAAGIEALPVDLVVAPPAPLPPVAKLAVAAAVGLGAYYLFMAFTEGA